MSKPRWRATALALASAVLLGSIASNAYALALGRITVQSALGEPLRAEIDIPEITADELSSLKVAVASPERFRLAGFEVNPALNGLQITLQKRPDGRYFLQLSSPRAINDPFVDIILETSWSSGRVVRDYTMLFDPPALRQPAPTVAAQVPNAPAAPAPSAARAPAQTPSRPAAATESRAATASSRTAPAAQQAQPGEGKQVTVRAGETAGKIAAANKPASVSLEQMLVALLRANPDAFVNGNVNRLRSGAVLQVPAGDEASFVPPDEAHETIVAQSRDFNDFRRRLAEGVATTQSPEAGRQASGKVQAKVEDKRPAAAAPDKLTLSKGAVQGKSGEDALAKDRAAKDAAQRVAELNKNLADLNRLSAATGSAPGAGASAAKPGLAVAGPTAAASAAKPASAAPAAKAASAPVPAAAPAATASAAKPASAPAAAVAAASAAKSASAPAATASAPAPTAQVASAAAAAAVPVAAAASAASAPVAAAASAPVAASSAAASAPVAAAAPVSASAAKPAAAKAAPVETSLLDDLLENPIVPAAVGGVLAFLLGFGFYRAQQRKKSTQVDSSFLESRLQPDSFFGASGGQRIDTNEGSPTGSSMVYSPSQLDAAGDVDPVAEADVYLAYGRDLQAEEILKEALRTTPQRVAIHSKLLEIYAKRRDAKAFELVATEAYGLTQGQGPEWEHICELGQELDSSNSLYRPGGAPSESAVAAAAAAPAASFGATTAQPAVAAAAAAPAVDLDLDLDFMLGDEPEAQAPAAAAPTPQAERTQAIEAAEPMPALDMDFGSASTVAVQPPAAPEPAPAPAAEPSTTDVPALNLDEGLSFDLDAPPPAAAAPAPAPSAAPAPAADAGMMEFDLGSLSLDLPGKAPAPAPAAAAPMSLSMPEIEEAAPSTSGAPLSTAGFEDTGGDPLATKLALAQEFNAIGDPDGARSLAQEVIAEASGELKSKAQKFLAEIG